LNPDNGFEVAQKGTNGFYAFVARTGDDTFHGTWPLKQYRSDILYPISFDEAGAKAQMRVFLDAAEMQAKGTPPEKLKELILHGPHGYMVQFRGVVERESITKQYGEMLARL
jgi:hypothetical protein